MPSATAVNDSYTVVHDHVLVAAVSDASNTVLQDELDSSFSLGDGSLGSGNAPDITSSPTGVLDNDSTDSGNPLSVSAVNGDASAVGTAITLSSGAQLTVLSDGSFLYVPKGNSVYTDSFTYVATDGANTATAMVNIGMTDQAPVAVDQVYLVHQGQALSVAAADGLLNGATDADGDSLTASIVSDPTDGTLEPSGDGSFTCTPDSGFAGTDSFTYEAFDGLEYSGTQTATILVANATPTASDLSYSVHGGQNLTVSAVAGVLSAASDADGDTLTASVVTSPSNGSLSLSSDGSFTYTPNTDFTGNDTFTYEAFDGAAYSGAATVTINVNNNGPTATSPTLSAAENGSLVITPANLGSDADGLPLTITAAGTPSNGTLTDNGDGTYTYTPNTSYTGADAFTYTISDGLGGADSGTATINVTQPKLYLSSAAYFANQGDTATITIGLTASVGADVTVQYATSDGTAAAGTDYTSESGTATIPAGQKSVTFTIPVLTDAAAPDGDQFNIALSNPTNAALGGMVQASFTILVAPAANADPTADLNNIYGEVEEVLDNVNDIVEGDEDYTFKKTLDAMVADRRSQDWTDYTKQVGYLNHRARFSCTAETLEI